MDVSEVPNVNLQGGTTTPDSQETDTAGQGVQGHYHHHHHKRSMTDMISVMESAIENAAEEGKLTDDQVSQMKEKLDSIIETLTRGQTSSGGQLTSDDLQMIRAEFHDVRKQLFDALNPKGSTLASNGIDKLFKQMDANGDGAIDQNEFSTFIDSLV